MTSRSTTGPRWRQSLTWLVPVVFAAFAAAFTVATYDVLDDHFDRLSRARQIARFGDLPFRDFFDPGYFLSLFASAAAQRMLGDNLLGEWLLDTGAITVGAVLVLYLAKRISGSYVVAVPVATLALLARPRAYDYDKVLFYPLGLACCWWYGRNPTLARLAGVAACLVVAALFRYDSGVYLGAAALVTLAVVHAPDWRAVGRRAAALTVLALLWASPALLFVQTHGGLLDAVDQVVTYARREGARTGNRPSLADVGLLSLAPPGTVSPTRNQGVILPDVGIRVHGRNASAFLFYLLAALPFAAVMALSVRGQGPAASRQETARLLSAAAMTGLLVMFVLRDPVSARIGGLAGPPAVIVAWLARRLARGWLPRLAFAAVGVLTITALSVVSGWEPRMVTDTLDWRRSLATVDRLSQRPLRLDALVENSVPGMVEYLRGCTAPSDRVLVAWYLPQAYFLAERGFAAGLPVVFGEHWSAPRYEQRAIATLARQSAPVLIFQTARYAEFTADYPRLAAYIDARYAHDAVTTFGRESGSYSVLVRRDRAPRRREPRWGLACFT